MKLQTITSLLALVITASANPLPLKIDSVNGFGSNTVVSGAVLTNGATVYGNITVNSGQVNGSGAGLTALNAAQLTTGVLPSSAHPALTGDVTTSASSVATTIAAGAVTDSKVASANKDGLANVAGMRTLGPGAQQAAPGNDSRFTDSRTPTGSAVNATGISGTYPNGLTNVDGSVPLRAHANIASGTVMGRATSGAGAPEVLSTIPTSTLPALTGDVTMSAGTSVTTIANVPDSALSANVVKRDSTLSGMIVTNGNIIVTNTTTHASTGVSNDMFIGSGAGIVLPFTGDVSISGMATTIGSGAVTLSKIQTVATASLLGRNTAGTGAVEVLSTLPTGTFPALTGDITTPGSSLATTLKNTGTAGTYYKTTYDAQGRETSGQSSFTETDLTTSDVTTGNATSLKHGFLPKLSGNSTDVLKGDGTYGAPPASGAIATTSTNGVTVGTSQQTINFTSDFTGSASGSTTTIGAGANVALQSNSQNWTNYYIPPIRATIDGNGNVIINGATNAPLFIDHNVQVHSYTMLADQTGTIQLDIRKCTYSQYDAGATHPVSGDSIVASAPPNITSAVKNQDSALTGWNTNWSSGDIIQIKVTSISSITKTSFTLSLVPR